MSKRLLVVIAVAVTLGTIGLFLLPFGLREFGKRGCRAAQFEAQMNLSRLFTAEEAFHERWGTYTTDLHSLDWKPMDNPAYVTGFRTPFVLTAGTAGTAGFPAGHDPERSHFGNARPPQDLPESFAERDRYVAGAAANLDDDPELDLWTIDEARNLVIVRSDCLPP